MNRNPHIHKMKFDLDFEGWFFYSSSLRFEFRAINLRVLTPSLKSHALTGWKACLCTKTSKLGLIRAARKDKILMPAGVCHPHKNIQGIQHF